MNCWLEFAHAAATAAVFTAATVLSIPASAAQEAQPAAVTYEVVDLGAGTRAYAVNAGGVVAGSIRDAQGVERPAIFRRGSARIVLNDFEGFFKSINAAGEAVGNSRLFPFTNSFHWKDGVTTLYPSLNLWDINDASVIVGAEAARAVKIENGAVVSLGTLGGDSATATAIDAAGIIYATRNDPTSEAVRIGLDGTVQSLSPPLPTEGWRSVVAASNRAGNVAGYWSDTNAKYHGIAIVDGVYHQIDGLAALTTNATSVNDHGTVVGAYGEVIDGTLIFTAFLWKAGTVMNLSSLPEVVAAGWRKLSYANAINNRGVVVGEGERSDGKVHGFVLIPRRR
jgi:uncharacterized membrane protein